MSRREAAAHHDGDLPALIFQDYAWPRLVHVDDRRVGFVTAFLDIPWAPERDPHDRSSGVWRLNIAADAQGKRCGRSAVEAACQEIRDRGGHQAFVTHEPRAGAPEAVYFKLGFRPTGERSGSQTVAVVGLRVVGGLA
ncbi:hypothetical protein Acy02nite_90870 [Actinoplanes cyaneus]|uniref:GNAT family N-acetyltransferase n=1 Tax=Actinoplanes cyaneus TaxID=52696 RepID=A0A919ITY1_9ACTN|nr:GNAT family N-acetyltransferase [Actinoplanes cyaneus]GID71206.1 hypothetical protein Acy02nite_90870 [Actinoplanes cyaneus]